MFFNRKICFVTIIKSNTFWVKKEYSEHMIRNSNHFFKKYLKYSIRIKIKCLNTWYVRILYKTVTFIRKTQKCYLVNLTVVTYKIVVYNKYMYGY